MSDIVGETDKEPLQVRESDLHAHLLARVAQRGITLGEIQQMMKIEYDPRRDFLYLWFGTLGEKAARTETVTAGVHADFDRHDRLVGIEVLDASEVMHEAIQFAVQLSDPTAQPGPT
jgi:uncharacterized protein YuzE